MAGRFRDRERPCGKASHRSAGLVPGALGLWRSLVAHLTGGQGVAGSNPVSPTEKQPLTCGNAGQGLVSFLSQIGLWHVYGPKTLALRLAGRDAASTAKSVHWSCREETRRVSRPMRSPGGAGERLKDVRHVRGGSVLLDVESLVIASEEWPRSAGGGVRVDQAVDQRRDRLAESVRGHPVEPGVCADCAPPPLDVADLVPGAVPGGEDRVVVVRRLFDAPAHRGRRQRTAAARWCAWTSRTSAWAFGRCPSRSRS